MQNLLSDITSATLLKREFVHKLARKIEEFGLTDDQRQILITDLCRSFENHELVIATSSVLRDVFGDTARVGRDDENQG